MKNDIGWDKVNAAVKVPLKDLRLAPYYGCTLTRPKDVSIDGGVTPAIFKEFIEVIGATPVDFAYDEECCSSYQMVSNPEAAVETASKVVRSAEDQGADALILSCPLCEYNLGRRQGDIIQKHDDLKPLPTFYFTQLLAVALGVGNFLALSGDHQKFGNHPQAKGVYDIDSIQFIQMMKMMRDEKKFINGEDISGEVPMFIGAAANPFADPFEYRVKRLAKKINAGADYIQTQAVYDVPRFRRYMEMACELELDKNPLRYVIRGIIFIASAYTRPGWPPSGRPVTLLSSMVTE